MHFSSTIFSCFHPCSESELFFKTRQGTLVIKCSIPAPGSPVLAPAVLAPATSSIKPAPRGSVLLLEARLPWSRVLTSVQIRFGHKRQQIQNSSGLNKAHLILPRFESRERRSGDCPESLHVPHTYPPPASLLPNGASAPWRRPGWPSCHQAPQCHPGWQKKRGVRRPHPHPSRTLPGSRLPSAGTWSRGHTWLQGRRGGIARVRMAGNPGLLLRKEK